MRYCFNDFQSGPRVTRQHSNWDTFQGIHRCQSLVIAGQMSGTFFYLFASTINIIESSHYKNIRERCSFSHIDPGLYFPFDVSGGIGGDFKRQACANTATADKPRAFLPHYILGIIICVLSFPIGLHSRCFN